MLLKPLTRKIYLIAAIVILFFLQGCSTRYIVKSPEYTGYGGEANRHSRLISAERDRIFQIITDEEEFRKICPEGTIVSHESPLPYQVGTIVKTKIDHIFKLGWKARVMEIIPGRKIRLQFLDGFFSGGTEIWELQEDGDGTGISHTVIVSPGGIIRKIFWNLKVRRKHDKMVDIFLDNLKKVCETP